MSNTNKPKPLTSAERSRRYRQKQIAKIGHDAYKARRAQQARDRRARAKLALKESTGEDKLVQDLLSMVKSMKLSSNATPEFKEAAAKEILSAAKLKIQEFKKEQDCDDIKHLFIEQSKKDGKPITQKSADQYFAKIGTVYKRMYGRKWDCKDLAWLKDTDNVISFVNNNWANASTRWNYILAITSVLKRFVGYEDAYAVYSSLSKAGLADYLDKRSDNILTPEEAKRILPWETIMKTRVQNKSIPRIKKILFLLMQARPRRSGTYRTLQWRTTDTDDANYLIMRGNNLWVVLKKYKQSAMKTYGPQEYELTPLLKSMVTSYVRRNKITDGTYLFTQNNGKPLTEGNFSAYLSDMSANIFGPQHRMGSRDYRKSKASYIARQPLSTKQMAFEANALGHSVAQLNLYKKIGL